MAKRRPTTELHVAPAEGGWAVKRAGETTVRQFPTRQQATKAAQELLRHSGGALRVYGSKGQVVDTLTLGRDSMTKINSMEGLRLSSDMSRRFAEFDALGLSSEERRQRIKAVYAPKKR